MRPAVVPAVERGFTLPMAVGVGDPVGLARIVAEQRRSAAAARAAFVRLGLPVRRFDRRNAALAAMVARLQAAGGAKKVPALIHPAVAVPTALMGALAQVDTLIQRRLMRADPVVAGYTAVAGQVMELRSAAGARSSLESTWLSGAKATPALIARIDRLTGSVSTLWTDIQRSARVLPPDPALRQALAATRRGFFGTAEAGFRKTAALVVAHDRGVQTLAQLHSFAAHWLGTLQAPRDAVLAAARREAMVHRHQAMVRFGLAAFAMLLASVVALGGALLLWRRVILALGRLTAVLVQLAAGALETAVPDRDRGDEIGAMAQAVETLRNGAAEARRLATEAAAAQEKKLPRPSAWPPCSPGSSAEPGKPSPASLPPPAPCNGPPTRCMTLPRARRARPDRSPKAPPAPPPGSINWPRRPRNSRPPSARSRHA